MNILIKQTLETLREDLGYEEWEDINEDALLFRQGYDGYVIEVEDGDSFEIPEGTEGQIMDDNTYYFNEEIFENMFEKVEIEGDLCAGHYKLEGDVIIPQCSNNYNF